MKVAWSWLQTVKLVRLAFCRSMVRFLLGKYAGLSLTFGLMMWQNAATYRAPKPLFLGGGVFKPTKDENPKNSWQLLSWQPAGVPFQHLGANRQ